MRIDVGGMDVLWNVFHQHLCRYTLYIHAELMSIPVIMIELGGKNGVNTTMNGGAENTRITTTVSKDGLILSERKFRAL